MRLFKCLHCGQLLYFENTRCERCGHSLGFHSDEMDLLTLVNVDGVIFSAVGEETKRFRYCGNAVHLVCNWLIAEDKPDTLCVACTLNRTIPDLSQPLLQTRWARMEVAKHRLVYTLLKLGLPLTSKAEDLQTGLAFDFLAELTPGPKVITGHEEGLITINVAEADESERARNKEVLGEPYRTLLGHFRHEVGHYYWNQVVRDDAARLKQFRRLFGDERSDYKTALEEYYATGPNANWQQAFVSAYASSHPWEDWAETWAHYLHMMDTLETAYSFGLRISPVPVSKVAAVSASYEQDPFREKTFDSLINHWFPLTVAVNSLNRSMGQPDFYPFVIAAPVVDKLKFVHSVCWQSKA